MTDLYEHVAQPETGRRTPAGERRWIESNDIPIAHPGISIDAMPGITEPDFGNTTAKMAKMTTKGLVTVPSRSRDARRYHSYSRGIVPIAPN